MDKDYYIKINSEELNLVVKFNCCLRCGTTTKKLTEHHVVPQRIEMERNMLVPLCRRCHDKIHEVETPSVMGHLNKMKNDFVFSLDRAILMFKDKLK